MSDDVPAGGSGPTGPPGCPEGERRRCERHPTPGARASLIRPEGAIGRAVHGELADIGAGGGASLCEVMPPPRVPLWPWLVPIGWRTGAIDVVESRLVEASLDRSGGRAAYLEFVAPCPEGLLGRAVNGGRWPEAGRMVATSPRSDRSWSPGSASAGVARPARPRRARPCRHDLRARQPLLPDHDLLQPYAGPGRGADLRFRRESRRAFLGVAATLGI
jgi:hypothetical protein